MAGEQPLEELVEFGDVRCVRTEHQRRRPVAGPRRRRCRPPRRVGRRSRRRPDAPARRARRPVAVRTATTATPSTTGIVGAPRPRTGGGDERSAGRSGSAARSAASRSPGSAVSRGPQERDQRGDACRRRSRRARASSIADRRRASASTQTSAERQRRPEQEVGAQRRHPEAPHQAWPAPGCRRAPAGQRGEGDEHRHDDGVGHRAARRRCCGSAPQRGRLTIGGADADGGGDADGGDVPGLALGQRVGVADGRRVGRVLEPQRRP